MVLLNVINDNWQYSPEPIRELPIVEVTDEEYEQLLLGLLKFENGKLVVNEIGVLQKELDELNAWFRYYDVQVSQYNRCVRLGLEFDKNIEELDAEAVKKAERINAVRESMSSK